MAASESIAAIVFYLGVAALVVGAMLAARRAIERLPGRSTLGLALLAFGALGIASAVALFATGPRGMLPF